MKIACLHCAQHIELDESWFGKLLNCPNCRGVIDVPGKLFQEFTSDVQLAQRDRPRTGRTIYFALTAVLLVLIPTSFFWHGFFQADSDEASVSRQEKVAKQSGGEGLTTDPNSDPISKLITAPEETPSSLDGEATAESMDHSSQPDSGDTGGGDGSSSQHPSVLFLTRDGGKITWRSSKPCATELMLRRGELPERTKGREMPWTDGKDKVTVVSVSQRPTLAHEAVLTGLRPGTRYYYKVRQAETADTPDGEWSREYAFVTHAAEGEVEFLRFPLKTLLIPNLINVESVRPETPFPEPMSESDIQRYYKDQWKEVELFYWANSGMKYLIDHDVYVDETMVRIGDISKGQFKSEAEKTKYEALPSMDHGTRKAIRAQDQQLEKMINASPNSGKVYFGKMAVECIRDWKERQKAWNYRRSGGLAWGIRGWPKPARTRFLGGSNVAWLMCHEYKHMVESMYAVSGLDKPEDRMLYCHFRVIRPGWDRPSAGDHGTHHDGIAWQLRHHKRDSYLRSLFGIAEVASDKDGDGIPDDDPRVPLDEKRLGSSPMSEDTDSDGLLDLEEVLASTWAHGMFSDVRRRVEVDYIRPDLRKADSDGDGIRDGLDKYPIYPYSTEIAQGTATIDGKLDEWTGEPQIKFSAQGVTVEVWSRWNNASNNPSHEPDETDAVFYAVRMTGDWSNLSAIFDLEANGLFVGNDNLHLDFAHDAKKGAELKNVKLEPGYVAQEVKESDDFTSDDLRLASAINGDQQVLEFAIPKRDVIGLSLKPDEEIGLMLHVGLPDKREIAVFEPYDIFDSTLVE
jgi:hypothetical protein